MASSSSASSATASNGSWYADGAQLAADRCAPTPTLYLTALPSAQELAHINPWLHHVFHGNRAAKCGLFAIAMIMVGHITEHFHQEHGQHEDQVKFKALQDRIAVLEEKVLQSEVHDKQR